MIESTETIVIDAFELNPRFDQVFVNSRLFLCFGTKEAAIHADPSGVVSCWHRDNFKSELDKRRAAKEKAQKQAAQEVTTTKEADKPAKATTKKADKTTSTTATKEADKPAEPEQPTTEPEKEKGEADV